MPGLLPDPHAPIVGTWTVNPLLLGVVYHMACQIWISYDLLERGKYGLKMNVVFKVLAFKSCRETSASELKVISVSPKPNSLQF
jgi:hypothetical protein